MRIGSSAALAAAACFVLPAPAAADPVVVASAGTFAAPPAAARFDRRALACIGDARDTAPCTLRAAARAPVRLAIAPIPAASTVVTPDASSAFTQFANVLRAGGWLGDPPVGSDAARAQSFGAVIGGRRYAALLTLYRWGDGYAQACDVTDLGPAR